MLLASYVGTRPGLQGVANLIIRRRFGRAESHSEVVFEPGDGVDDLMPDGTAAPDAEGRLWGFSFVAAERLPLDSPRRAGKIGGGRLKRIKVHGQPQWTVQKFYRDARAAARLALDLRGMAYAWWLVAGWAGWLLRRVQRSHMVCSQFPAIVFGLARPDLIDPGLMADILRAENAHRGAACR